MKNIPSVSLIRCMALAFAVHLVGTPAAFGGMYWVAVEDAGELKPGHVVQWRGQAVGEVTHIRPHAEKGSEIRFLLEPEYEGLMHDEATFRVNSGILTGRPSLDIYGRLKDGVSPPQEQRDADETAVREAPTVPLPELPDQSLRETVLILLGLALVAGFIFFVGRRIVRMIAVGFVILLFLAALAFSYTQWQRYQEAYMSSSVEAAVTDLGDGVFRSESARRYWDEIQVDLFRTLDRLTEQGREVSATELESQWRDQLEERIDQLTREGAAEETLAALKRFQQEMSKLIRRLSQYGKLVSSEPPDD